MTRRLALLLLVLACCTAAASPACGGEELSELEQQARARVERLREAAERLAESLGAPAPTRGR